MPDEPVNLDPSIDRIAGVDGELPNSVLLAVQPGVAHGYTDFSGKWVTFVPHVVAIDVTRMVHHRAYERRKQQ